MPNRTKCILLISVMAVFCVAEPRVHLSWTDHAADGMQGGMHHLIAASVGSNGKTYVAKAQAGEKRWMRGGVNKDIKGIIDSFVVS
jgi:PsbP